MTNKKNDLSTQAIDFSTEARVHIAGGHRTEIKGFSNDFKAPQPKNHSDLRGKRTVKWCSSAVERPVHIGKVGGSRPSTTTVPLLKLLSKPGVAERFWSKVKIGHYAHCWEWEGARKRKATYQSAYFKAASYVTVSATRSAYALSTGCEPGELWVLHHCDNPACCNPAHLYLGTVKENAADAKARKRFRKVPLPGEQNPRAKLTAEQVEEVRHLFADGLSNVAIASRFGVHHSTISKIRTRNSW